MMTRRGWICGLVAGMMFPAMAAYGQEDPGKAVIGRVGVSVYYGTNGTLQPKAAAVPAGIEKRLRGEERLRFEKYQALGSDVQPLLRSYESWAQPLKPSDEVLVRFEAGSQPTQKLTRLDLELWLSRKKILKTYATLEGERPLFILGPEWRGGRLIIAVALAHQEKPGP